MTNGTGTDVTFEGAWCIRMVSEKDNLYLTASAPPH